MLSIKSCSFFGLRPFGRFGYPETSQDFSNELEWIDDPQVPENKAKNSHQMGRTVGEGLWLKMSR